MFSSEREFKIKTAMEMYKLSNALYLHSEYRTAYEMSYHEKLSKLREKYTEVNFDYNIKEKVSENENGECTYKLTLSADLFDKSFNTLEVEKELDDLMDDVMDYIILNTNINLK